MRLNNRKFQQTTPLAVRIIFPHRIIFLHILDKQMERHFTKGNTTGIDDFTCLHHFSSIIILLVDWLFWVISRLILFPFACRSVERIIARARAAKKCLYFVRQWRKWNETNKQKKTKRWKSNEERERQSEQLIFCCYSTANNDVHTERPNDRTTEHIGNYSLTHDIHVCFECGVGARSLIIEREHTTPLFARVCVWAHETKWKPFTSEHITLVLTKWKKRQ